MAQELYDLPEGWEWKTLEELTKIIGGGTPKTSNPAFWGEDVIWLSPTDLPKIGTISKIEDSAKKISQLGLEKSSARLLPEGAIVFSTRATIGKIAIAGKPLATNQGFTNFICSEKITAEFLCFALVNFTGDIESLSNSTTFKEVSKTNIKQFQIPVPPLAEQERIVGRLDALFSRIDQTIAQLKHTQAQTQALWASALDAAFTEATKNQPTSKLSEICTITSSKRIHKSDYVESGIPFFRTKEIVELGSGKNISSTLYITAKQFEEIDSKFGSPNKGDLLFSAVGTIGKMWIADGRTFYFKDGNLLWLKDYSDITPEYLKHTIRITLEQQIKDRSQGAAYKAISIQNLKSFEIPLPPLPEQAKIVSQLDALSERTQALTATTTRQLDQLTALKASLLDAAFRGQL